MYIRLACRVSFPSKLLPPKVEDSDPLYEFLGRGRFSEQRSVLELSMLTWF